MTTRPQTDVIEDSVEPLLEELLAEVVTGTRSEHKGTEGESLTAALTEAAMASFSRTVAQASGVERALLVEALAPALAEALAPALAKTLAPEIVSALSHLAASAESAYDESEAVHEESRETHDESGTEGSESSGSKKARRGRGE